MAVLDGSLADRGAGCGSDASFDQRQTGRAHGTEHSVHRAQSVASMIEAEVIPRLVLAHQQHGYAAPLRQAHAPAVGEHEIDILVTLALQHEIPALVEFVETLIARGVSTDMLFVGLFAPAARRIGEMWDEDACDFIDVTMALWRLQELVYEISGRVPAKAAPSLPLTGLIVPMPGDQHSFGSMMVEESFRHAGWQTLDVRDAQAEDLIRIVRFRHVDVVGLTLSCDVDVKTARSLVESLRAASRNAALVVMIGGRVVNDQPGLVAATGADGTAKTGGEAVIEAEMLVETLAHSVARGF